MTLLSKECSSGVGTPNFGELKYIRFDFGEKMDKLKRTSYQTF